VAELTVVKLRIGQNEARSACHLAVQQHTLGVTGRRDRAIQYSTSLRE
jgi:hypothetical protein